MKYSSFLITFLLLLDSAQAAPVHIQDLMSIKNAAEKFVHSKVGIEKDSKRRTVVTVGNLDPRLRLTACDAELITYSPPGSRMQGNTTVGVRCGSPKPWSIYIAVKISIFEQAVVAVNKMKRGTVISSSDLKLIEVDTSKVRGHTYTDKLTLIGTKLKSSVATNQVIDSATVCLICIGDSVVIKVNNNMVAVTMSGKALNGGSKGDKIRVQNNASKRIVDAIITGTGTVKVFL